MRGSTHVNKGSYRFRGQNLPSRGSGVQLVKKFSASYIKKVFTITMQFEVLA
jgi:hypothetical protein